VITPAFRTLSRLAVVAGIGLALAACDVGKEPTGGQDQGANADPQTGSDGNLHPNADDIGDTLRVGLRAGPDGFLGIVQNSATGQMLSSLIQPGLVDSDFQDGKLTYLPLLATRWEFSQNDKKLTFYLRKDVTWPDGHPITARDVAFTIDLVGDPEVASPRQSSLEKMDHEEPVTVLDDYTVRFNFTVAYNHTTMIANAASVEIVPEHKLKDVPRGSLRTHPFHKKQPFGHGPYTLQEWKPKESLTLIRNPDVKTEPPAYIQRILIRIIPEYQTQLKALQNGQIDLMEAISAKDIDEVKTWPDVTVYTKGYRFMDYIGWNLQNDLFKDRDVRRALTMAIDIKKMIRALLTFNGHAYGTQAYSTLTPELTAYRAKAPTFLPYDPDKAKRILRDKGWKPGPDGILMKDGKRFEFKLATNNENPRRAQAVVMVEQDLKKIGIKANIEKYEGVKFFARLDHKQFEAALAGWSAALFVDPSDIWATPTAKEKRPFNFCSYSNPRVDELISKGLATSDPEVERKCWIEMQNIIYEDQPYTFLFWRSESFACNKRFRGIKPNVLTTYYKLPKWWVPKAEHKFKF